MGILDFILKKRERDHKEEKSSVSLETYETELYRYFFSFYMDNWAGYQERLNMYFASPESRLFEKNENSPWAIARELCEVVIRRTKELLIIEQMEDGLFEPVREAVFVDLTVSPISLVCGKISERNNKNGVSYRISEGEIFKDFPKDMKFRKVDIWSSHFLRLVSKAVALNWRPRILVEGTPGKHNRLLYYDEELNLMVSYRPDDNYYHWGGNYVCYVHIPTKGRRYYDDEKQIGYEYCPLNYTTIEFEYSEMNEKRYRAWVKSAGGKSVFSGWREFLYCVEMVEE